MEGWWLGWQPIEANVPAGLEAHIIMDNYGTHKTALIRKRFAKRPRFHLHFTPTYASWINLVKHSFAEITNQHTRRGIFPKRERTGSRDG
jgi:transposase